MASVRNEIPIAAPAAEVWDAIRDFHRVHERVAPGFLTALEPQDGARLVTFANGAVARELLVNCDDARRRLVYAIPEGRMVTYSASVQVFDTGPQTSRVDWIIDLLPNELADYVKDQTAIAVPIMQRTLALP